MSGSLFVMLILGGFDYSPTPIVGPTNVYKTNASCESAMKEKAFDLVSRDPTLRVDKETSFPGQELNLVNEDYSKGFLLLCREILPELAL